MTPVSRGARRPAPPAGLASGVAIAAVGWLALATQFVLITRATHLAGDGWWLGASRFFGFFTILTNVLVAAVLTAPVLRGRVAHRLCGSGVRAATAVYIIVVGLVYSAVLRQLWSPEGAQYLVDAALHDVIPVAYVLHWLVYVARGTLTVSFVPPALWYPLGFAAYALLRGAATGWYPYPFIDAGVLGYRAVAVNVVVLTAVFAAVALAVVGLDRLAGRLAGGRHPV